MTGATLEKNLTSKKLLINNSLISLLIQGGPALLAFFTIPLMITGLGNEKFGILTLIWAIIGASSIFDFGIGQALTQFVAKKLGLKETEDIQNYIATAVASIFMLGLVVSVIVFLAAPFIAKKFIHISPAFVNDSIGSFRLLAITIPFLMLNISIIRLLEACQEFKLIGLLKIPVVFCNYVAPVFILFFSKSLIAVVSVLVLGRIASCLAYLWFGRKIILIFSKEIKIKTAYLKPLLTFGSWVTVSNIVNTIVVNIDRFIIAGLISAEVVAFYTTPLDALSRIYTIPMALMSVMFPAFSSEFFSNIERARNLYFKSMKIIFFIVAPICIILFLFAKQGLTMWVGSAFAESSHVIAKIIILGVFLQSLNILNYNFVLATGKSEVQAKIYLAEFPVYLASLWFFIKYFGLVGAALAWLFRITLDFLLFNFFALRLIKLRRNDEKK